MKTENTKNGTTTKKREEEERKKIKPFLLW
jgi:hypothetical protein